MGTVINGSKINDFCIAGTKINGFAKNGQVIFKKDKKKIFQCTIKIEPYNTPATSVTVTLAANKKFTLNGGGTWNKYDDYTYKKVYFANGIYNFNAVSEDEEVRPIIFEINNIIEE